jgi:hypothetical protein
MSFKAKFKVAGKELNVLDCNYSLHQETDPTGRPSSVTRGGRINLRVESTNETDLFEWICNNFQTKDGSVVYLKRDSDATMKELKFKEGYLVDFAESFDAANDNPMTTNISISAKEITLGNGTHRNEWV